jgi:hypothetical protein
MLNQTVAAIEIAQGVVFGLLAYAAFRKKRAKLALCHKARGEVIAVREKAGGEATSYHPVIKYKAISGEDVTFESKYGSSNWNVKVGDQLDILVNRTNPTDAEVETFMAQWGVTLIFTIISVMGFIAAPMMFFLLKQ